MTQRILLFLLSLLTAVVTFGQPGTEIFIFDLETHHGTLKLSAPRNISEHIGYDNQPFFHSTLPLLYYVSADTSGNTDIFEFNYETRKKKRLQETSEREYSPQVTPDGKSISCIIQRENGAQDLGRYPINGGTATILINNLTVGYHAWLDNNSVIVFTLPQPFSLHLIDFRTKKDSIVAHNIGRSLHKIPGQNALSFVQKVGDERGEIKKFEVARKKISTIVKSISSKDHDMAWTSDGKIVMSNGNKIFVYDSTVIGDWKEIIIQSNIPLNTITRLAVNSKGDKIALVINE
jgi:tricorn protease-like protein